MSPDGPKNIPPEERLLRLIRGKSAGDRAGTIPASEGVPSVEKPTASSPAPSKPRWSLPSWWLIAVNVTLGCVAAVLLITIAILAFQPALQPLDLTTSPPISTDDHSTLSSLDLPLSGQEQGGVGFSASAAGRSLFQPVLATSSGSPSRQPGAMSVEAKTLASRLNVIGLVDGNPPQAIIEDTQTQKTYFVAAGQQVTEGLVVTEIRDNRVVLDLNGQTIELSF